jgi:hypothetical protein
MYTGVLIDSLSIQQYIFSSNKLREQIGASYIVEKLMFDECIPLALQQIFGMLQAPSCHLWMQNHGLYGLAEDGNSHFEIGYIGGGNALVLFRDAGEAKRFVTLYSRILLEHFPGLKTAFAIGEFHYEGEAYRDCRRKLNEHLVRNRNLMHSVTYPFKHGIFDDCDLSGEAKEIKGKDGAFVSSISKSRQMYVSEASAALKADLLDEGAAPKYMFTENQELLGQAEEKGYIAIVHADGNKMGQRFMEAMSLEETRRLSHSTKEFSRSVMKALIGDVLDVIERGWDFPTLKVEDGKRILPIRPIIMGGDDITFVCEGRLGLFLAERLLKHMTETPIDRQNIQACAGVLLVHSKFPFYKAYKVCEEITTVAKKCSRGTVHSWLQYHISSGGISGTYAEILANEFTLNNGKCLKYGPYVVNHAEHGNPASIYELKKGVLDMMKQWPRNKAKELRDLLRKPEGDLNFFKTSLNVHPKREDMKPALENNGRGVWHDGKTPFYDRIELLDFYPQELLNYSMDLR